MAVAALSVRILVCDLDFGLWVRRVARSAGCCRVPRARCALFLRFVGTGLSRSGRFEAGQGGDEGFGSGCVGVACDAGGDRKQPQSEAVWVPIVALDDHAGRASASLRSVPWRVGRSRTRFGSGRIRAVEDCAARCLAARMRCSQRARRRWRSSTSGLTGAGVGDARGQPQSVAVGEAEWGTGMRAFLAHGHPHVSRPAGQLQHSGSLGDPRRVDLPVTVVGWSRPSPGVGRQLFVRYASPRLM
jgi:hypothetical protein